MKASKLGIIFETKCVVLKKMKEVRDMKRRLFTSLAIVGCVLVLSLDALAKNQGGGFRGGPASETKGVGCSSNRKGDLLRERTREQLRTQDQLSDKTRDRLRERDQLRIHNPQGVN